MTGYLRWLRFSYNAVAWLFVACVVVQIYLAGVGVFATGSFDTHRDFGYTFGILTLVLLVLSIVGRMPRRWIGASAALLGLFALQSIFVAFRSTVPMFAALHPLNGFLIGLLALATAWQTRAYLRAPRAASIVAAPPPPPEPAAETKPT